MNITPTHVPLFVWFEITEHAGVLETNPRGAAPPLELQIARRHDGRLSAWWLTDRGAVLRVAEVGIA